MSDYLTCEFIHLPRSKWPKEVLEQFAEARRKESMNCPHCGKPLDSAQLRKALNAEIARNKRPGAKGLVRNPAGRPKNASKLHRGAP